MVRASNGMLLKMELNDYPKSSMLLTLCKFLIESKIEVENIANEKCKCKNVANVIKANLPKVSNKINHVTYFGFPNHLTIKKWLEAKQNIDYVSTRNLCKYIYFSF